MSGRYVLKKDAWFCRKELKSGPRWKLLTKRLINLLHADDIPFKVKQSEKEIIVEFPYNPELITRVIEADPEKGTMRIL